VLDHVATYTCGANGCGIATCATGFFNVDTTTSTGCECAQDEHEPNRFVSNARGAKNIAPNGVTDDGYDITVTGNFVPSGTSDFYWFHATDESLSNFNLTATLKNIPAGTNYDLYLYRWNGSAWAQIDSSTTGGNANEEVNFDPGLFDDSATGDYGFEVRYVSGPITCARYTLNVNDP